MRVLKDERHNKIREYLRYHGNCSKTAIARLLVQDHPLLFDGVEATRNQIKYVTGNAGNKNRKLISNKEDMNESGLKNIYGLCDEERNDIEPYVLPKHLKNIGIISDVHIPYQSNEAVTIALDYLKDHNIDTLILNGDIIDFYQASSFVRDPGQRDLKYELDSARNFVQALRKEFPNVHMVFKEGNHCFRWKRFLLLKAPEVFRMSEFRIDVILGLAELKIDWVDNNKIIKVGKLNVLHGHEYPGTYSPVNPAKGIYNKSATNTLIGHHHQTSEHISKNLNNEITGAWSVGCLCELQPAYMPYNKHNHGFAHVKIVDDKGSFKVYNKKIIDGEMI